MVIAAAAAAAIASSLSLGNYYDLLFMLLFLLFVCYLGCVACMLPPHWFQESNPTQKRATLFLKTHFVFWRKALFLSSVLMPLCLVHCKSEERINMKTLGKALQFLIPLFHKDFYLKGISLLLICLLAENARNECEWIQFFLFLFLLKILVAVQIHFMHWLGWVDGELAFWNLKKERKK